MLLGSRICVVRSCRCQLENEMHVNSIPHGRPVSMNPGPKPQRPQDFSESPIVSAITRRIERDQHSVSLLVYIEPSNEVVGLDSIRRGKRRNEEISQRRRIILSGSATSARSDAAAATSAHARSNSAAAAWASARAGVSACISIGSRRHGYLAHRRCGCNRRLNLRFWLRRFYWRNRERFWLRHHCRVGSHPHKLEMLFSRAAGIHSSAASTRWARTPAAERRLVSEIGRADDWCQDEKKDHRVHE